MGALQGNLTYKLFYVDGEIEDFQAFQAELVARVQHRAFAPLDPDEEDEERTGWVPVETPLVVEFDLHKVLYDHFINLTMRQDKYAVPGGLLRAHIAKAERDLLDQKRAQDPTNARTRLSKYERDEVRDNVNRQLKRQSLPKMSVLDMSWDLRSKRVRFWSQSNKMCELFQGLFEDTFGLKLVPANPYINALHAGLSPEQIERLTVIEPSAFIQTDTLPSA